MPALLLFYTYATAPKYRYRIATLLLEFKNRFETALLLKLTAKAPEIYYTTSIPQGIQPIAQEI